MTDNPRNDPVKNSAMERLYYAVKQCIECGITANELREELAASWEQVHRENGEYGATDIRKGAA
jgi:hypothetical protein